MELRSSVNWLTFDIYGLPVTMASSHANATTADYHCIQWTEAIFSCMKLHFSSGINSPTVMEVRFTPVLVRTSTDQQAGIQLDQPAMDPLEGKLHLLQLTNSATALILHCPPQHRYNRIRENAAAVVRFVITSFWSN